MENIFWGKKELTEAPLVYGTLPLGPLQANLEAEAGGALVRHALERGVKWLDTAELYGTYGHIRKGLDGISGKSPDPQSWLALGRRNRRLKIMDDFCKGCGQCVPACASGALSVVDERVRLDEDSCILCGYCAASCPEFIIRVV